MKTAHIEKKKTLLLGRREKLIAQFSDAARARQRIARICAAIRQANDFLATLDQIVAENAPNPGSPRRYTVSSLFLYESFRKLTADQDEQFFFVTGPEVEGVQVLDQSAEFVHKKRTRVGVVADLAATHNLLIKLEQFGHKLLAHFHSHPGNGPSATQPSGTDQNFQKRLENAGHIAVMAIFSRDGFVRVIRLDQSFELEIYGQGVEKHAPGIYRLTNLD